MRRREPADPRALGVALLGRPVPPPAAVVLGQGTEPGVGLEPVAHRLAPPLEAQVGTLFPPEQVEGAALQRPHRVAVDERAAVEVAAPGRQLLDRRVARRAGQRLDAQREGGRPPPAGREVRARLDTVDRQRRVQRVDRDHPRPPRGGPGPDCPQVDQVADAPALGRAARRQLDRQDPRPQVGRQVAAAGGDDQPGERAPVEGVEVVVAGRKVGRQGALGPVLRAVLQPQLARPEQGLGRPGPDHPQRPFGRRRAVPGVPAGRHRGAECGAGLGRRGVPVAMHVEVAVVDAPGVCGHSASARYPATQVAVRGT